MKTLKFDESQIASITEGSITSTWRLADEKNIQVNDEIQFISSSNGQKFADIIVDEVTTKRIDDITAEDMVGHQQYDSISDILDSFKKYYGALINNESLVKIIKFHINAKNSVDKKTTTYDLVKLYTDGGSRGNPGPSASGFVLYDEQDNVIYAGGEYLGITTNNQAEYQAVRLGLKKALELSPKEVKIYMDSLLVVNQMNGVFKIKNRDLWPIHSDIKGLVEKIPKVSFTHVPREFNKEADAEVNRVLDSTPL
jgi:ribonuclease HI